MEMYISGQQEKSPRKYNRNRRLFLPRLRLWFARHAKLEFFSLAAPLTAPARLALFQAFSETGRVRDNSDIYRELDAFERNQRERREET